MSQHEDYMGDLNADLYILDTVHAVPVAQIGAMCEKLRRQYFIEVAASFSVFTYFLGLEPENSRFQQGNMSASRRRTTYPESDHR